MPTSPGGLCRDCSKRAVANGYCADHQVKNNASEYKRLYDRYRADDPIRLLYRSKRWTGPRGTRKTVLRRDILCQAEGGCPNAATVSDHHPLSAREIVERLGKDAFYDPSRCRGLCKSHHDSKTATQDSTFAGKRTEQQQEETPR